VIFHMAKLMLVNSQSSKSLKAQKTAKEPQSKESQSTEIVFRTGDIPGVVVSTMVQLQGTVDALAVFTCQVLAHLRNEDPVTVAASFDSTRIDCTRRRARDLERKYPPPPSGTTEPVAEGSGLAGITDLANTIGELLKHVVAMNSKSQIRR
jgi:hypothetical protein